MCLRYLVFEFVDKNLLEVLEMFPTGLDPESVTLIVYQLVKAIEYCHAHDVIHRWVSISFSCLFRVTDVK